MDFFGSSTDWHVRYIARTAVIIFKHGSLLYSAKSGKASRKVVNASECRTSDSMDCLRCPTSCCAWTEIYGCDSKKIPHWEFISDMCCVEAWFLLKYHLWNALARALTSIFGFSFDPVEDGSVTVHLASGGTAKLGEWWRLKVENGTQSHEYTSLCTITSTSTSTTNTRSGVSLWTGHLPLN